MIHHPLQTHPSSLFGPTAAQLVSPVRVHPTRGVSTQGRRKGNTVEKGKSMQLSNRQVHLIFCIQLQTKGLGFLHSAAYRRRVDVWSARRELPPHPPVHHLPPCSPTKMDKHKCKHFTFDCLNSASSTFETCNCRSASVILRAPTGSGAFKSAMAAATFSGVAGTCVVDIL